MKIKYKDINFRSKSLVLIDYINVVIAEYQNMGYDLTLRQIYYQLVSRDIIPNNERSYKNIGKLISDGRLAGLIDWEVIVDRTRNLRAISHWSSPAEIIATCANQFSLDKWVDQENYLEVWVEKDALIGIVGQTCSRFDVPYFSCRGYVSQSELWAASYRLLSKLHKHDRVVILHLGDHDPSGIDISRDIEERLNLFGVDLKFERIALNMNQILALSPPPNPTKVTDTRCGEYISRFGTSCWELDALKPDYIDQLISSRIRNYLDGSLFKFHKNREMEYRRSLGVVADNWDDVVDYCSTL